MLAFNGALRPKSLNPDPLFSSVSLLMHFDGSAADNSSFNNTFTTVGTPTFTTTNFKFGTACYLGATATGFRKTTGLTPFNFGTGDFTIEFWVNKQSVSATNNMILTGRSSASNAFQWICFITLSTIFFQTSLISLTGALASNAWIHVAISRTGTTTKLFTNGIMLAQSTVDNSNYTTAELNVATDGSLGSVVSLLPNNRLDDLRITKGYGRYTADFTPPTAAFPNY
jgi:hypothetical protein